MTPTSSRAWRWLARLSGLAVVLLVLAAVLAILAHTPAARRAVLRRAIATLEERYGLALDARALRYNLSALRVTLEGVALAAVESRDVPFFAADSVEVTVPRTALLGPFSLQSVHAENARLTIVQGAGGMTNLPSGAGGNGGTPAALPVGHISIPQLSVTVSDEPNGLSLALPALSVDVRPDTGSIQLAGPGRLQRGSVTTALTRFGGGVAFDGRAIDLVQFAVATGEADLAFDGTLALLVVEPGVALTFSGRGDVAGLARWATTEPLPTGSFLIDGAVRGPFSAPAVMARVREGGLTLPFMAPGGSLEQDPPYVSDISAEFLVDLERLTVSAFDAALADGRVNGTAEVPFGTDPMQVTASWRNLSTVALVRTLAPSTDVVPAARATGTLSFRGTPTDMAAWTIDLETRLDAGGSARGRIPVSGAARLRIDDGAWQLDTSPTIAGASVQTRLRGRLNTDSLTDSTLGGTIALGRSDLTRLLASLRTTTLADVPEELFTGGSIEMEAAVSGTFSRPRVRLTAQARELMAAGVSNLAADVTAEGTAQQMAVEARVRQGAHNAILASGTVWPGEARLEMRVTGTVSDSAGLVEDLPIGGVADLQFDVAGPFDGLAGSGTATIEGARYGEFHAGRLDATFAVDVDAAHLALTADELGARATARVPRAGSRTAAVDLEVDRADLARVVRDATMPVGVSGRVSLTARGEGSLDAWRQGTASLEVSELDAAAGDLSISLNGPARLTYGDETLDVERLEASVGETRVSIEGRLPASGGAPAVSPADALRATLVGDIAHALAALRATGAVDVPDIAAAGPLVLLARLSGSAERPLMAADLELGPGRLVLVGTPLASGSTQEDPADVGAIDALHVRAHFEDGWLNLLSASGEWQGSQISAEGRAPLRLFEEYLPDALADAAAGAAGPAVLTARALAITPEVLTGFVSADTRGQIEGSIDASAQLTAASSSLDDLVGEVALDRLDIRVANLPVAQREPTRITFDAGFARVAAWDWVGQGATVAVQGQVRLADREAAIRAGGRIDLQMLTPFVREAGLTTSGTLTPLIAVTGPLDAPAINAEVTLADGGLRLAQPRVIATDLVAKAVVSQLGARITDVSGSVNGGVLSGGGQVEYGGPGPTSARVDLDVAGMALEFPQGLRSELDADLILALTIADEVPRGRLSGTVTVLRSAYREPIAVVTGLLGALRSDRLTTIASQPDSFADRLALDVRVVTDSDVIVDNNVARLQLGGDLRVIGTAAAPALSGRATLREGGELLLGPNRYRIEDVGTIDFENPVTVEPDINIRARTRAGGEEIELTLTGTPETLAPSLSSPSTPELGQADLASLLLTGRRLDDVPGAEGQIVGEQVLAYLSGDVLGVASRAVGLDTIRLGGVDQTLRRDPAAIATETDPTSRMTFGKSVGEALEITLSQSLRNSDAQTWIVDYRATRQLALRLVSGDDQLRGYELRHDVSFGPPVTSALAAPRPRAPVVKVTAVAIDGNPGGLETQLRDELRVRPGDTFDFTEWQRDRDRLERLLHERGRLEGRVTADRREDAAGVALSYDVEAGPPTAIVVTGYTLPRETRRALELAWTQSVFDDFLEDEAAALVRRALVEDGYLEPEVVADVSAGDTKTLSIAITPGQRVVERRVVVEADDDALVRELDRWIRDQRLTEAAWQEPAALEGAVTTYLQARGHLSATVAAAPPVVDGRTATVAVRVEPGPMFTLGEVRFTGAERLPIDALAETAALAGGSTYEPDAVTRARARVLGSYRREGFADARVSAEQRIDPAAARVDLVFAIEEGPRQVLRDVSVAGNRSIDTDVITRSLDLTVGEPLGADAWLEARSRLFDTALFRRVDVTTVPLPDAPATGAEQPVRVQATVQEWPALRLRYGFQISEERPEGEIEGRDLVPGLSADLTRRTFFGRALTAGAVLEYQRRDRSARLFANAPTLFGLPIESLITGHRSRQEFVSTTLLTDRAGVSWEQRMRIMPALRVSYSYGFDRDHTFETEPDPNFPVFDVTVNVARLNAAAVFDTRDDPLDTARGLLLSSSLDYASGGLGSDVSFLSHLAQAYYFRPWRQVVFASAARLGVATPLAGQDLIPSERYFAGGARTVRGVPEEGLGPRDFEGAAAGGGSLLVLNQEVRFPIFRWVRGVGFADAGNVFAAPSAIDLRQLVGSVGAGLRITTPFALLRADYGRVWTETEGLTSGRWTFGIGQAF